MIRPPHPPVASRRVPPSPQRGEGWGEGAIIALLLFVALLFSSSAHAEKTSLSYVTWNADSGYIMAAIDKGYFAEEGLDVDLTSAGGGVAVPAVISGSLDFTGSGSSAISAILKDAHMKVVLVGQDRPAGSFGR